VRRIGPAVMLTLSLMLAPIAEPQAAGKVYRIGYLESHLRFHDSESVGGFEVVPKVQLPSESIVLAVGARLLLTSDLSGRVLTRDLSGFR
jgi:hypothetical protein